MHHFITIIFLRAHTFNFKLSGGTSSFPYDLSQGLSLCKPQLFAEWLDW